jgi:fibro-slime domain-containing protein
MSRHLWLALAIGSVACGSSNGDTGGAGGAGGALGVGGSAAAGGASQAGGAGGAGVSGGAAGSIVIATGGSAGTSSSGDSGTGGPVFGTDGGLPPGFTMTDKGGYKVGDPIPTDGGTPDAGIPSGGMRCNSTLTGIVRDMKDTHRDFERLCCGDTRNALNATIGADRKPVYAGTGPTHGVNNGSELMSGPTEFNEWYRNVDGVNAPFFVHFFFVPGDGGVFTFHSSAFFPLDKKGWGDQGRNHNFHFTTELHSQFQYRGGEIFRFTGDDDLWLFVNDRLAIDLGGVHAAENAEVSLDARAQEFGIEKGKVYAFDLFHAERHTSESNFRVDTNLDFVNCGIIIPK